MADAYLPPPITTDPQPHTNELGFKVLPHLSIYFCRLPEFSSIDDVVNHSASAGYPSLCTRLPEALEWDFPARNLKHSLVSSPLLLCPEVGFDDKPMHGEVDN